LYGQDPGLVGAERPGDPSLATGDGLLDDWGHQWGSIQEDAEAPAHQPGGDFRKELGTFRIQPKQDLRAVRGRLEGELGVQEVLPGERHHTAVSPTAGRDDPFALAFNDPLFTKVHDRLPPEQHVGFVQAPRGWDLYLKSIVGHDGDARRFDSTAAKAILKDTSRFGEHGWSCIGRGMRRLNVNQQVL